MAAHNPSLPWETLSSRYTPNFVKLTNTKVAATPSFIGRKPEKGERGDTYYRNIFEFQPHARPVLYKFAVALRRQASKDAKKLLQRHANIGEPASHDDIIVSDLIARSITPAIHRWRTSLYNGHPLHLPPGPKLCSSQVTLCRHKTGRRCNCVLPRSQRRYAAFYPLVYPCRWPCDNHSPPKDDFDVEFSRAVMKILLARNEAVPILLALKTPKNAPVEDPEERGVFLTNCDSCGQKWRPYLHNTLLAYIGLNILYGLPEIWHPRAKREPWHDYRDTNTYQSFVAALKDGASHSRGDAEHFPQVDFFEMPTCWTLMPFHQKYADRAPVRVSQGSNNGGSKPRPGTMPFSSFAGKNADRKRELYNTPTAFDARGATLFLRENGLPSEIINMILPLAGDEAWSFAVPDDPLNPRNKPMLTRYLEQCWNGIVLSSLLLEASKEVRPDGLIRSVFAAMSAFDGIGAYTHYSTSWR